MPKTDEKTAGNGPERTAPARRSVIAEYYWNELNARIEHRRSEALSEENTAELEAFAEQGLKLAMPWLALHSPDFLWREDFLNFCESNEEMISEQELVVRFAQSLYFQQAVGPPGRFLAEEVQDMAEEMKVELAGLEKILGLVRRDETGEGESR